jgi:uncharacterized protein YbjT (DUF2867 family)
MFRQRPGATLMSSKRTKEDAMTTILVTGSTGTIGTRTVQRLASMPGITVRAAVHRRPASPQPKNVQLLEFDIGDRADLIAAASGVDAALLITPSVPNQVELAEQAVNALVVADVPRLVRLSAIGADWQEPALFMREHAETEKQIVASGIPYTFLRPNSYMSNFLTFYRPDPEGNVCLPWGDAGVSLVDPRDVADVAAEVLTTGDHVGNAYTLTGPEPITANEIASIISKTTGRRINYVDMPEEAMRQGMLTQGLPAVMVDSVLDLFATNRSRKTAAVTDAIREITGHPARSFGQFARDHAWGWKDAGEPVPTAAR